MKVTAQFKLCLIPLWVSSLQKLWFMDAGFVALLLTINETVKWRSLLLILMREPLWWRQCSKHIVPVFPHHLGFWSMPAALQTQLSNKFKQPTNSAAQQPPTNNIKASDKKSSGAV